MLVQVGYVELEVALGRTKTCHIQWLQHAGCVGWHAANMYLVVIEVFQGLVAQCVRAIPIQNEPTPLLVIWNEGTKMNLLKPNSI